MPPADDSQREVRELIHREEEQEADEEDVEEEDLIFGLSPFRQSSPRPIMTTMKKKLPLKYVKMIYT